MLIHTTSPPTGQLHSLGSERLDASLWAGLSSSPAGRKRPSWRSLLVDPDHVN